VTPTIEYRRRGAEVLIQVEGITDGELAEVAVGLLARVGDLSEISRAVRDAPIGQHVVPLSGERVLVERTKGSDDAA
jgi:hypothetical protein